VNDREQQQEETPDHQSLGERVRHLVAEVVSEGGDELGRALGSISATVGQEIERRVDLVKSKLGRDDESAETGVIPDDARIVKPAKSGDTWLAWHESRWIPVHRVANVGWVRSDE